MPLYNISVLLKYLILFKIFLVNCHTHPGFLVGQPLGVLELGCEGDLDLAELRHLRLGLLQLAQKVGVLDAQLLLGGIEVVEGSVGLVELALDLVQLLLELLGNLLGGGLWNSEW